MRHRCPICRTSTDSEKNADFPFCSERCRLIDLGNWATEKYKVSTPLFDGSSDEVSEENESANETEDDEPHDREKNKGGDGNHVQ